MIPIILNIDTALEQAIISLSEGGKILDFIINNEPKGHASILHLAIRDLLKKYSIHPKHLDAIALTAGPGSYTGLRVGMAAAKGLCYALNIPMITIGTLELMATNAILEDYEEVMYCPMIDARRMEVYTALYDKKLNELMPPCSIILDEQTFGEELKKGKIIFFGNGALKFTMLQKHGSAMFKNIQMNPQTMAVISFEKFNKKEFSNTTDNQPLYIKEFFTINSSPKT